jgi:putative molybdopterin biosynthesis protein
MTTRKHGRRYYLSDIPLDEAIQKFDHALQEAGALSRSPAEEVSLEKAIGRVTAEPVWAASSSTH